MNDAEIQEMREKYATGDWTHEALAKEYDTTVYHVKKCLEGVVKPPKTREQRFWEKAHIPENLNDCWVWAASTDRDGYGVFDGGRDSPEKTKRANRWAFLLTYGWLPRDREICHTCDKPICVNPAHLRPGTRKDNAEEMAERGRSSPRPKLSPIQRLEAVVLWEWVKGAENEHDLRLAIAKRFDVSGTAIVLAAKGDRYKLQHLAMKQAEQEEGEREAQWAKDGWLTFEEWFELRDKAHRADQAAKQASEEDQK